MFGRMAGVTMPGQRVQIIRVARSLGDTPFEVCLIAYTGW
jgi:hypothetical protein